MLSFRPITSRALARLRGRSLADVAERTVEIAVATTWRVQPPVMLPDAVARIRGHHVDSSPERNMLHLNGPTLKQGPTRMHLVRDVLIADGAVLATGAYNRIGVGKPRLVLTGKPAPIDEAALCSDYVTQRYFGHWLKDGLAHEQLASDRNLQPLVLDRPPWSHEAGYRDLVSLHPASVSYARCDRLWLLDDHEFNRSFVERYGRIRERLRVQVGAPAEPRARIFMARGKSGIGRGLSNEMEVRAALEKRGFEVLEPEAMAATDIARKLSDARLVVSPEGSALAHAAIAMPRGAGLLAIIGAQHFNLTYKALSDVLGFRFGMAIADALDEQQFSQPVEALLKTVDLLEAAIDRG
ncbi:MAG TPA: glycosyltransferase family 61 protein [Sphingomicrobium sp.]